MDEDLELMSREQLIAEARKLREGIRAHRDSSGEPHPLFCWSRSMKPLVAVVLVALAVFDAYVVYHSGYLSVFPPFESVATWQIFTDLGVALGLVLVWIYHDWRARGGRLAGFLGFFAATALLSSLGPLIYLLARDIRPARSSEG